MKTIEKQNYLETDEAIHLLGISRDTFFRKVKPHLRVYRFAGMDKPWYWEKDVLDLKNGKPRRTADIIIRGIFADWTAHLRSLGYQGATIEREIRLTTMPEEASIFDISPEMAAVMRSRLSEANTERICTWATYYPVEVMEPDIIEEMKHEHEFHAVKRIKERRGIKIAHVRERYGARLATLEEQELLQLPTSEPIFTLQRAAWTKDGQLVLYSTMALLGSWFAAESEYDVNIWNE